MNGPDNLQTTSDGPHLTVTRQSLEHAQDSYVEAERRAIEDRHPR